MLNITSSKMLLPLLVLGGSEPSSFSTLLLELLPQDCTMLISPILMPED